MSIQLLQGDCIEVLKTMPAKGVHCCVTSPPYYGLRDYGVESQIGVETAPEDYIAKLMEVFSGIWRVLRDDGTLWLNLGDSYNGSGGAGGDYNKGGLKEGQPKYRGRIVHDLKPKDLIGIPWEVAFALRSAGWYLRSDIIWHKPDPMPESVTDRPTKSHEYVFLLTKSQNYFFDAEAIREKSTGQTGKAADFKRATKEASIPNQAKLQHRADRDHTEDSGTRNKRSVWTVSTSNYKGAHFATYPPDLIKPMILAGTSEKGCCEKCGAPRERVLEDKTIKAHDGETKSLYPDGTNAKSLAKLRQAARERGEEYSSAKTTIGWQATCDCDAGSVPCTVIDPFSGSGTTGEVAIGLGRSYIGIELNSEYIELSRKRLLQPGMSFF